MEKRLWSVMLALLITLIFSGCQESTEDSSNTDTTSDTTAPKINSTIVSASIVDSNALILSWDPATDNVDNGSDLIYRVYWSNLNNIDTLDNLETNGVLFKQAIGDSAVVSIKGIPAFANNYFNVVVEDSSGNKAIYATRPLSTGPLGSYSTNSGYSHYITATNWTNPSAYGDSKWTFTKVNAEEQYLIAVNEVNPWNQEKYSRFDWTIDTNGDLWYCQIEYAADTEAIAEANNSAKPVDLASCGLGVWTKLAPFTALPGAYVDSSSDVHKINASKWSIGASDFHVTKIDSSNGYIVARNDGSNDTNPDLYSRFDWIYNNNGDLLYCQIYDIGTTEASADAVTSADSNNLATGCGGFAWESLSSFDEITGEYLNRSSWGTYSHIIGTTRWQMTDSVFHILKINAAEDYLIAQSDPANTWNGGLYSRMDWTRDASGDLYYCQITYDATSDAEAESVTLANRASLSGGCGGWPWSKLDPFPSY